MFKVHVPLKCVILNLIMATSACEELVAAVGKKFTVPLVVLTAVNQFARIPKRRRKASNVFFLPWDYVGLLMQDYPAAEISRDAR